MRLGILQPYFFPYLGYFDVIACVDRWIVFDTPQYVRHHWMNRNRILHPTRGWQYVVVPVRKHHRKATIQEIEICDDTDWRARILGQLRHYRRAPHFERTVDLISECLSYSGRWLARLDVFALECVCRRLGLRFDYVYFSEIGLEVDASEPGDWALEICRALEATEYVNPPGGAPLFDRRKFEEAGIRLTIRRLEPLVYETPGYGFEPSLSIIDVLMWNSLERITEHLREDAPG